MGVFGSKSWRIGNRTASRFQLVRLMMRWTVSNLTAYLALPSCEEQQLQNQSSLFPVCGAVYGAQPGYIRIQMQLHSAPSTVEPAEIDLKAGDITVMKRPGLVIISY